MASSIKKRRTLIFVALGVGLLIALLAFVWRIPVSELTVALEPEIGGTVTDLTDASPYARGTEVHLKAEVAAGYRFVNWTAPAGEFTDASLAETTFIMPGKAVRVTANFVAQHRLTISSTADGSVVTPGEGIFTYDEGAVVDLAAEAEEGYYFVNWSGDVSTVACVIAATTTVTMNADYSIMANFEEWVWTFPNPNIEAIVGDITERGYLFPSDVQGHNTFHPQP